MKKLALAILLLLCASLGYCSLPLTSVAVLTLTLSDQTGRKIVQDSSATFLDAAGATIVTITPQTPGSWDNNLHWWSHSSHATSNLRPGDARRTAAVRIEAKNCATATIPVALERQYEGFSVMPHGGGPAYFIYRFEREVVLHCS